jgi:hypothetical protein
MKHLIALLAAMTVGMTACDNKNEAAPAGSEAPAVSTTPAPVAAPADRSTAEGTVALFIEAMAKADYPAAMALVDETSEGYAEIISAQDAMDAAEGKGDDAVSLKPLFVMAFTRAWQDVTPEKVGEAEGSVRYSLVFARSNPVSIDVRNATGEWLVVAGKDIVVIEAPEGMGDAPAPAPTRPPADTPAGG